MEALWPLIVGIWGILEGSGGGGPRIMLNIARFKSLLGLQDSAKSLLKPRPHKLGVQFCEVQDVSVCTGFRVSRFRVSRLCTRLSIPSCSCVVSLS